MARLTEKDTRMLATFRDNGPVSHDECKWMADRLEEVLNEQYDRNKTVQDANSGAVGVWHWQGDGFDHPESLTCPVLMSADQVREFIKHSDAYKLMRLNQLQNLGWNEVDELMNNFRWDGTLTEKGQEITAIAGELQRIMSSKSEEADELMGFEYSYVNVSMSIATASITIGDIQVLCSESTSEEDFNVNGCLEAYREEVSRLQKTLP